MNSNGISSIPRFIHSLRIRTWEWMDWIEYPYPTTPFPCIPGMVGTDGNDWEWIEVLTTKGAL
jgi:hypothetical protein